VLLDELSEDVLDDDTLLLLELLLLEILLVLDEDSDDVLLLLLVLELDELDWLDVLDEEILLVLELLDTSSPHSWSYASPLPLLYRNATSASLSGLFQNATSSISPDQYSPCRDDEPISNVSVPTLMPLV